ncbi:histidine phosphatase family protein [Paraferrimonas sp. SM1919]|uniref:histidine phosphatase family protein n=1 Tax=Paraferrimonas sp. SM1919 TaxID=2662263 RepID=UPI0013D8D43D|nr:histidine phosphatase family protein [Paraferrimonas sp. SM1919]
MQIYLIRHGQASFASADYDRLSDLGCQQMQILGERLKGALTPDACFSGDMLRHAQSFEHFFEGHGSRLGCAIHTGFNEFDHQQVLHRHNPEFVNGQALAAFAAKQKQPKRILAKEFALAMQRWQSGDYDDYTESYQAFTERTWQGMHDITKAEHQSVLVFTSGGVISSLCQQLFGADNATMINLNQKVVNSSITKISFSNQRFKLDYFNNYAHIEGQKHLCTLV